MADLIRLAVFLVVVIDPISATIGAAALASGRSDRERVVIVAGGAAVAGALLAALALVADPVLDALDISSGAALLAAGIIVLVPALDLLWQGPAGRVRADPRASAPRLALFPLGVPLLAGPGAAAAVIAWSAAEGSGLTAGAAALAAVVVGAVLLLWRQPPCGRRARVLGAFTAVAMTIVAFDLVRDGVFAT